MHNYSSTKLKLLALKWAVTENFCDYLLGLKIHVYTDNNPLAYVRESKLGTSQIQWLSELALFDFTIHYQTGRSPKATNAVSRCPHNDDSKMSDSDSDEIEVLLILIHTWIPPKYQMTSRKKHYLYKLHSKPIIEEEDAEEIEGMSNSVPVLNQVTPEDMVEEQKKDPILKLVCLYVTAGEKLKSLAITKTTSKLYRNICYSLTE